MNILELFARIGLKADTGPANQFLGTVKNIQGQLVGAVAGTLSLAAAVRAVNDSMSKALEFKKFAAETGQSADQLQRWANVADQVSGSGDAVAASIRAIAQNQEKIKLGQGNISGYQLLGIDPRSNPFEVLEQLRGKLSDLSPAMRRNIASQFGISPDLVMTLELTNDQFDKMASRAWIIPQGNIDGLNKMRSSLSEVQRAFAYMQAELATKLGPAIDIVVKGIIGFAQMATRAVLMIDKIIQGSIGWRAAIIGVIGVMALLNAQFLLSPIGLFTMAIILLVAVLEDLYVYSQGGESLFGMFVDQFPALGKAFDWLTDVGKVLQELMKLLTNKDWSGIESLLEKWGIFGEMIIGLIDAFRLLTALMNPNKTFAPSSITATQAAQEIFSPAAIAGDIKDAVTGLKQLFTNPKQWWDDQIEAGRRQRAQSKAGYEALMSGEAGLLDVITKRFQGVSNPPENNTTTIAPVININGVTDPVAAGQAAAREVQRTVNAAQIHKQSPMGER
jgi:hypothetical protein